MTSPAVWVPLTIAFGTGACTWATLMIRLMWQFRGKWDDTNSSLARMTDQIRDLTTRDATLEDRLQRHLDWHIRAGRVGQSPPPRRG